MTQDVVTRFAPSPTGRLHLGHAWSALQAFDVAKKAGGRFLLRIEDIDEGRCRAPFVDAIFEDLRWLGLDWDGDIMIQSERKNAYASALSSLQERGLTYRCWCTRSEIAASAAAPQGNEAILYPGTCKSRDGGDENLPFCWRLDVEKASALVGGLSWFDQDVGQIVARPDALGDVIIARKDAPTTYHLAVTVDDAAQGVTDVVRGQDLFASTHTHRLLQAVLGLSTPTYHHHPLLAGSDGERLAKRRQSPAIAALRESGTDPRKLIADMRSGRFPFGFALIKA